MTVSLIGPQACFLRSAFSTLPLSHFYSLPFHQTSTPNRTETGPHKNGAGTARCPLRTGMKVGDRLMYYNALFLVLTPCDLNESSANLARHFVGKYLALAWTQEC